MLDMEEHTPSMPNRFRDCESISVEASILMPERNGTAGENEKALSLGDGSDGEERRCRRRREGEEVEVAKEDRVA